MLDAKFVQSLIEKSVEHKKVSLETVGTDCHVKKLIRKDTVKMTGSEDIVSSMVLVGVVDEKGEPVFESLDQVLSLPDKVVAELFNAVNEFNNESVEAQAKK